MSQLKEFNNHRLLVYYKGDISALTLFAQQENGSVCFPQALPVLSSTFEDMPTLHNNIHLHPAVLVNGINQLWHLENDLLHAEPGFCEYVDTPNGIITVYMARFKLLDPPHKLMQLLQCRLQTLPALRNSSPAELQLLRRAYEHVMES